MLSAHYRLGQHRPMGESRVAVYPADDPVWFGPALQVVTEHGSMLMDSVTVLLHRLGVGYTTIMTPVFEVHRGPTGELQRVEPKSRDASPYVGEAWIRPTRRRSRPKPSPKSNSCCPRSWLMFSVSPRMRRQ